MNKPKSAVKLNDPINKVIKLIYREGFSYIPVFGNNKRVVEVVAPRRLINFSGNE